MKEKYHFKDFPCDICNTNGEFVSSSCNERFICVERLSWCQWKLTSPTMKRNSSDGHLYSSPNIYYLTACVSDAEEDGDTGIPPDERMNQFFLMRIHDKKPKECVFCKHETGLFDNTGAMILHNILSDLLPYPIQEFPETRLFLMDIWEFMNTHMEPAYKSKYRWDMSAFSAMQTTEAEK